MKELTISHYSRFLVLILLVVSIVFSLLFTTCVHYFLRAVHDEPIKGVAHDVSHAVFVAYYLPIEKLTLHLPLLRRPWMSVKIENHPLKNSIKILHKSEELTRIVRSFVIQKQYSSRLSVKLISNKWLTIALHKPNHGVMIWIAFGFLLLSLVGLFTFFCSRFIKHIFTPLDQFSKALDHFNSEGKIELVMETGTRAVQAIIKSFNKMMSQSNRLAVDRTRMLATISHDLRSPITRLKLHLENLSETVNVKKLLNDIKIMEKMITSILIFSKCDYLQEKKKRFDLDALLESICGNMSDAGYAVSYSGFGEQLVIEGRMLVLQRALQNIIDNAVKYGQKARVSLKKVEGIQVKICDEGPGIPDSELENVFLPFYRVINTRIMDQQEGIGLGLSSARNIIHSQGGEIFLINQETRGLCVIINFPNDVCISK